MNKKLILILSLSSAPMVYAGEDVDLVKSAMPDGLVTINSVRGELEIKGWDKNQISIQGELDDLAEKLIFHVDGNRTSIEVKMPKRNISWGDGSDLKIMVPRNSRVDVVGVSADVEVDAVHGGLRVKSVSGDIYTEDLVGQVMLSTVSGEVRIDESKGSLHASSVSGNLDVLSHIGEIDLETVSGDVEIFASENNKLRVRAVSGEIDVKCDLTEGAIVDLKSISGEIELELVGKAGAEFDIDAGMSGEIDNKFSDHEVEVSTFGRESLSMMVGDGSGRVIIRTMSADIKIE